MSGEGCGEERRTEEKRFKWGHLKFNPNVSGHFVLAQLPILIPAYREHVLFRSEEWQ